MRRFWRQPYFEGEIPREHGVTSGWIAVNIFLFLCSDLKDKFDILEYDDNNPQKIFISGGVAKNKIWADLPERKLGRELTPVDSNTIRGAAKMIKESK